MDKNANETSFSVKLCADCWVCKYTRNCKKPNMLYYICRGVEKICPWCFLANRKLKKDFQKSNYL